MSFSSSPCPFDFTSPTHMGLEYCGVPPSSARRLRNEGNFCRSAGALRGLSPNFLYEYFDEIIIIFYYRSQTELIPSVWAQKINGNERSSISFSDYLDKIKSYTPTNMAPHSNLTSFKTNFNGLVVNTIDKENLQGGNIFEDFSSITGFKFQNIDKIEYENVTAGHVSLNLHRAINKIFKFIPSSLFFLPKSIINLVSTFLSQDKIKHLNERELPDKCLLDNKKTNEDFLKGRSVMLPTKKY